MKWIIKKIPIVFFVLGILKLFYQKKEIDSLEIYGRKYLIYFQLMDRWLASKYEGKKVSDFLEKEKIKKVAIYGLGNMANRLVEELDGEKVEVEYGIDRDICVTSSNLKNIYSPLEILPPVDAIIVTPIFEYEIIKNDINKKYSYRVISLETIIYSL